MTLTFGHVRLARRLAGALAATVAAGCGDGGATQLHPCAAAAYAARTCIELHLAGPTDVVVNELQVASAQIDFGGGGGGHDEFAAAHLPVAVALLPSAVRAGELAIEVDFNRVGGDLGDGVTLGYAHVVDAAGIRAGDHKSYAPPFEPAPGAGAR